MPEERDPDLNEDKDIIHERSREEHRRDVYEVDEDKSKIRALRWEVYTMEREKLINIESLVSVPHPKSGGGLF